MENGMGKRVVDGQRPNQGNHGEFREGAGIAAGYPHPRFADVIFDYCDVLLDWRPRAALEGVYPAATLDWFFDARTPYGFWHYDALSDSGWSEDAIIADFAAHHPGGLPEISSAAGAVGHIAAAGGPAAGGPAVPCGDDDAAAALFRTYFARQNLALRGMIPGMAGLLADLDAAGVRLWGLTNFTAKFVHAAWDRFPALGLLRGTVVSSEERIRKPDAEIYRRTVERFGIDPATAAFVDDKERNARASEEVGLTGVRFLEAAQARAALLDARYA